MFQAVAGSRARAYAGIPGPPPSFPLGNLRDFVGRPAWEVFASYAERHGPLVLVWFGRSPALFLNDPELLWRVYEKDFDRYYKANPAAALTPFLTRLCEFQTNGERWERNRRANPVNIVLPAQGEADSIPDASTLDLERLRTMVSERVRSLVERTASGPVNLRPAFVRVAFDALSLASFGALLGEQPFRDYSRQTALASRRMMSPSLPLFLQPHVLAARRRWRARLKAAVAQARREGAEGHLLGAMADQAAPLDDATLAIHFSNAHFGGVQSVASAILSTLYLLAKHPEVEEQVRSEVKARLAAPSPAFSLEGCEALEFAILEALRLYPPAPIYSRNTTPEGPVELGGHLLPPNTVIYISNWGLQRSPARYEQPEAFMPRRWAEGGKARNPLGSGYYFPFGRGRRSCSGQRLALILTKQVVAGVLSAARLKLGPQARFDPELFFGVLLPKQLKGRLLSV
jgi:cytochrome P450